MKLHPELQALVDIELESERAQKMGFLRFQFGGPLDFPKVVEVWQVGSRATMDNAISVIKELQKRIEHMERDHAETISDLLHELR